MAATAPKFTFTDPVTWKDSFSLPLSPIPTSKFPEKGLCSTCVSSLVPVQWLWPDVAVGEGQVKGSLWATRMFQNVSTTQGPCYRPCRSWQGRSLLRESQWAKGQPGVWWSAVPQTGLLDGYLDLEGQTERELREVLVIFFSLWQHSLKNINSYFFYRWQWWSLSKRIDFTTFTSCPADLAVNKFEWL